MEHVEHQHLSATARRLIVWIFIPVALFNLLLFGTIYIALGDAGVIVPMIGIPVLFMLLYVLMMSSTLSVRIDAEGVHAKARWFHRTWRSFAWTDVERVTLRPLRAFGEFGGWGIRYGFGRKWGYIYDGDTGLEIELRDGRRFVISITDNAGAEAALTGSGLDVTHR